MRRHDHDPGVAGGVGQHLVGPLGVIPPLADRDQQAHQGTHHRVAERIRANRRLEVVAGAGRAELPERTSRRRAFAALAERREVVQAEQALAGGVHGIDVEAALPPYDGGACQRVGPGRTVEHPVGVAALQGGEAGVEAVRGDGQRPQDDVVGQEPPQPALEVDRIDVVEVDVSHLAARVHAGIGAPGAGELR